MVKKFLRKMGVLAIAMSITVMTSVSAYAKERRESDYVLPPTEASYIHADFDILLPTGSGEGFIDLRNHYYDVDASYGYAPSLTVSMATNVVCDFSVDITAVDDWDMTYTICKGAYQAYSFYDKVTSPSMNMYWIDIYGDIWVCDDEGEAGFDVRDIFESN